MNCKICNNVLTGKQQKFCSVKCKQKDINLKHQNYTKQSERGLEIKKKLLEMLGGKCSKCGYNKNYSGLCFHHLKDKSFQIDIRKCANTKWEVLVSECNKCVVLCHNCHMEEHYPHHEKLVQPAGLEPAINKL